MSKSKREDSALVRRMLDEAVRWFRESRKHPDNVGRDPYELARECANGAFQNLAWTIPEARKEIVARKFMGACRERFAYEVPKAASEVEETELAAVN